MKYIVREQCPRSRAVLSYDSTSQSHCTPTPAQCDVGHSCLKRGSLELQRRGSPLVAPEERSLTIPSTVPRAIYNKTFTATCTTTPQLRVKRSPTPPIHSPSVHHYFFNNGKRRGKQIRTKIKDGIS
jgi:hypothetical protein